ncbi:MAG: hypothetical protein EVA52_01410 [Gammaproteobacteria bacterium]|nr:MAG: hypothetical protein EVA52_01410 [Gammaproteobacteria bacterium]
MSYAENNKRNLIMFLGLGISLLGVALYDPLGFLFTGMGLAVIAAGLSCMFAGYIYLNESEKINKAVDRFERK